MVHTVHVCFPPNLTKRGPLSALGLLSLCLPAVLGIELRIELAAYVPDIESSVYMSYVFEGLVRGRDWWCSAQWRERDAEKSCSDK